MSEGYYNLYLDECVHTDPTTSFYGILGVTVKQSIITNVRQDLGNLKISIWDNLDAQSAKNIVLHATDVHRANRKKSYIDPNYSVFSSNQKTRDLFLGVKDIILKNELGIMGCVVNKNSLNDRYKTKMNDYLADSICLKNIINNFTCFLKFHNARGNIIFESRSSSKSDLGDVRIKKLFYKTMTHGTDIYKPIELQSVIDGISFVKKQENDAGLQLTDFIAQPFIFNCCNKKQKTPNIYKDLRKRRYSGGVTFGGTDSNIFGVTYVR